MKELSKKQLSNCDEALHRLAVNLNVPIELIIKIFIAGTNNTEIIIPQKRFDELIEFVKTENFIQ